MQSGPTHLTSFNPHYFSKGLISKCSITEARASTNEFGIFHPLGGGGGKGLSVRKLELSCE